MIQPTREIKEGHSSPSPRAHETVLGRRELTKLSLSPAPVLQALFSSFCLSPQLILWSVCVCIFSLAYAELRNILARMLWNFDMELSDVSKNWRDQRVFVLWEKPGMMVKLTERKAT